MYSECWEKEKYMEPGVNKNETVRVQNVTSGTADLCLIFHRSTGGVGKNDDFKVNQYKLPSCTRTPTRCR